ncbi:hypothetical protein HanRHA438_Chr04g0197891 [Helianthus annuus]|nr:hypothetical protein HanRHA438_Chr04g0197891 [Helianthus annuus]
MVNISTRLDIQDQLLQQLQNDMANQSSRLDSITDTVDAYRAESAEFRKVMLAWMRVQETNHTDLPPKSGLSDLLGSGVDSGEVFTSSSLTSASNGDLSGDCSALLAQLEAIVSRSEARWCDPTISRISGSSSQLPFSMVSADAKTFGAGNLGSHRADWATSDSLQGKLGLDTIVGLRIQQKMVVDLGSTRLGSPGDVLTSAIQFLFRDTIYSASQLVSCPLPSFPLTGGNFRSNSTIDVQAVRKE